MSKNIMLFLLILLIVLLSFEDKKTVYPKEVYTVYLEGQIIGMVEDKEKFNDYIDRQADLLKEEYQVDKIYGPTTLQIVKNLTYKPNVQDYETVFKSIHEPLSIEGYQITINREEGDLHYYVNDIKVFEKSIENIINSFVGTERYNLYSNNQQILSEVGSKIESIYLENNITFRKLKIPVTEEIYISSETLSKQLLFGTLEDQDRYAVKAGDTIEEVAFKNEISTEEFLVSNPEFTNKNNLLYEGQEVVIGITDPQISVVVEEHVVEDVAIAFKTETKYDTTKTVGYVTKVQTGAKGTERLTRNVKTVNGVVVYSDLLVREELTPAVNEIVVRGDKIVPNIGSSYGWTWPTAPGWTVTSGYAYRIHPFTGRREFHQAIDIAIGNGAHIYAANSGTIHFVGYNSSYGNYVVINHNNTQNNYTLYSHLSRYTVNLGQDVASGSLIGYMGSTGSATGPHLHFEVWVGKPWHAGSYRFNPWNVLK